MKQSTTLAQAQIQTTATLPVLIQVGRMMEMSASEAKDYVDEALELNPALEKAGDHDDHDDAPQQDGDDYDPQKDYRDDDDIPDYLRRAANNRSSDDERYQADIATDDSLYDCLMEQLAQYHLSERQLMIGGYIIGNIDSAGYLTRTVPQIALDIVMKESVDVEDDEVAHVLAIIKTLEPIGIAAATVRECLLTQLRQISRERPDDTADTAIKMVEKHFDEFTNRHYNRLSTLLRVSQEQIGQAVALIRRLNPKPGAGFTTERISDHLSTVSPDYRVDYDEDTDRITITTLNRLPELQVSQSYATANELAKARRPQQGRRPDPAARLVRDSYDNATQVIRLLRQRQDTLFAVVQAIVARQRQFFITCDEADLKPMTLKDIAPQVGVDVSVISRANTNKYIETRKGNFPFKFFFSESMTKGTGDDAEEVSTREIIKVLKELIDTEDKRHPLTDDALCARLQEHGYQIARRTVAKYREEKLNIPVARHRRQQH